MLELKRTLESLPCEFFGIHKPLDLSAVTLEGF